MSSDIHTTRKRKTPRELRLGYIAGLLFEDVLQRSKPHNIDLLDFFFPGMIVFEPAESDVTKTEALFSDSENIIIAVRNKSGFYTGGVSTRVSQIVGRLIGTAKSGIEKERRAAGLVQKRIAHELVTDPEKLFNLHMIYQGIIKNLSQNELDCMISVFAEYINAVIGARALMSDYTRENELFPFDDETFDLLMNYVLREWNDETLEHCIHAFTWLVFGSLMRNEVRRLLYAYDSTFTPREMDDADSFAKDTYTEYFYTGDDLDNRFPGIEWFCDRCGAHLNEQDDFDDHNKIWKCTCCGYKNVISIDQIYDNENDFQNGDPPTDAKKFFRALKERTDELDESE